jgi:hypothetical protein
MAAVVALGYWLLEAKRGVNEELEMIRQLDEPITFQELQVSYTLPDGATDTTALWVEAANMLDDEVFQVAAAELPLFALESSQADIPLPGQPWSMRNAVRMLLDDYEPALRLMHRAAEESAAARFDLDATSGLHEQQDGLRTAARLLTLEAYLRAHENDSTASAMALLTLLRLSESFRSEPSLNSQLIRSGMVRMALEAMQRLIPVTKFSDAHLATLQQQLRQADYDDGLHRGLLGDRVLGLIVFDDPSVLASEHVEVENLKALPTCNHDRRFYLQTMREFIATSQSQDPERLARIEQLDYVIEMKMNQRPRWFRYFISDLLLAAYPALFEATARLNFSRDAVDVGLAAQQYRRQHGSFPSELTALVPEFLPRVPLDPYDGQPIRYRVDNAKLVIYCLGRNRVDDGGIDKKVFDPHRGIADMLDVVVMFTYEPTESITPSSIEPR